MKLPNTEIELAAGTEQSRYTLQAVKLDVANKRMLATDGHILAIVPVEVSETDHDGLLTVDSIKQARKLHKSAKGISEMSVNGKFTVKTGAQSAEFDLTTGQFPNVDAVVRKCEGPPTITFNVDLLLRLAKAVAEKKYDGTRVVSLWIKGANDSIIVKGEIGNEAVGVLMPCRP